MPCVDWFKADADAPEIRRESWVTTVNAVRTRILGGEGPLRVVVGIDSKPSDKPLNASDRETTMRTAQTTPTSKVHSFKTMPPTAMAGAGPDVQAKLFVGVDMAAADFAVATVWQQQCTYVNKVANTAAECTAFVDRMEAERQACGATVIHLIIEPTGGYEAQLVSEAYRRQWLVTLVNLTQVRHWSKGRGKRAKTDRQDAIMLAQYGADQNPPAQQPIGDAAAQLDDLLRRQTDLEKLLHGERNRLGQAKANPRTSKAVPDSIERIIEALNNELAEIAAEIKRLMAQQAELAFQFANLRTINGIGPKNGLVLLTACHRFYARTNGHGTAKEFVAFAGLDPLPFESGTSIAHRATISRQGDPRLRATLYWAVMTAIRGDNHVHTVYNSFLGRNKPKKVALVACSRKMLVWAWAIFTQGTTFDPSRFASA
jgi:transposase